MANPQIENGHIDIANEIAEHLAYYRLSGEEYQVLWVILRKTWGWKKKSDFIALSQFQKYTKMKKPNICRALKKLESKNIIIKKDNAIANEYRFNKDFDSWKPLSKKITVIKKDNRSLSKKIHTKETNTKEIYIVQAQKLGELILERKPDYKDVLKEKERDWVNWANTFRLIAERDKRDMNLTNILISVCQKDSFWCKNICSAGKLRKQYDKLTDHFSADIDQILHKQREKKQAIEEQKKRLEDIKREEEELKNKKPMPKWLKEKLRKLPDEPEESPEEIRKKIKEELKSK